MKRKLIKLITQENGHLDFVEKTLLSLFTFFLFVKYYFQLDRDGLHDLNVQGDWQKKNGTYWVRYVHVELLGHDSYGKSVANASILGLFQVVL